MVVRKLLQAVLIFARAQKSSWAKSRTNMRGEVEGLPISFALLFVFIRVCVSVSPRTVSASPRTFGEEDDGEERVRCGSRQRARCVFRSTFCTQPFGACHWETRVWFRSFLSS